MFMPQLLTHPGLIYCINFLLRLYLSKSGFIGVPGEPVEEGAGVCDASLHEHDQVEGLWLGVAQIQDESDAEAALGNFFFWGANSARGKFSFYLTNKLGLLSLFYKYLSR